MLDYLIRLVPAFATLERKVNQMSSKLDELQAALDALTATTNETITTLSGLVDRIVALEGDTDPAKLEALIAQAKQIQTDLAAAEDSADDKVTPPGE